MTFTAITIRPAEDKDIAKIWDLLHANSKTWSVGQISEDIRQLWVLMKQDKLLGVLYGNLTPGKEEIIWMIIHPLYPENQLKELMIKGLKVFFLVQGSYPENALE